jgi:NTP pyrophosphatase (non-canonical NTP hydrolase)
MNIYTIGELQKALVDRDSQSYKALEEEDSYMAMALSEESGEVCGVIKKGIRYRKNPDLLEPHKVRTLWEAGVTYEEQEKIDLSDELADTLCYLFVKRGGLI